LFCQSCTSRRRCDPGSSIHKFRSVNGCGEKGKNHRGGAIPATDISKILRQVKYLGDFLDIKPPELPGKKNAQAVFHTAGQTGS
jgi:hypothetical protein